MRRPEAARGDSKIGCIIWLILAAIFTMVLMEFIPVKMKSVEFYDYMQDQTKFAHRATAEAIRSRILKKAAEMEIPLKPGNLKVQLGGPRIVIECSYVIPVEFLGGFVYDWEFEHRIEDQIFYF